MKGKIATVSLGLLVGAAGLFAVTSGASAAPTPTFCVTHSTDLSLFPSATLRVAVREWSPIDDAATIVSVCKTETLIKTNGATAVVEDTCGTAVR